MLGMDWNDLQYVLALARHRTLSAAARELGVSHSTVSRRLQVLEDALGARLFDRSTSSGFSLTPIGEQVHARAEQTEAELLSMMASVLGEDQKLRGELRVTTMDIFLKQFASCFHAFATAYPDIELTLVANNEPASLIRREADVALRLTNEPPDYAVGRRLGELRFAVYGARHMLDGLDQRPLSRRRSPWEDLPWIVWDRRMNLTMIDAWLDAHASPTRSRIFVDVSSLLVQELVAAGMGVSFLSTMAGERDERLCRIGPPLDSFGSGLWALTLKELRTNSKVRAMLDHLSESLSDPALLQPPLEKAWEHAT